MCLEASGGGDATGRIKRSQAAIGPPAHGVFPVGSWRLWVPWGFLESNCLI